MRNTAWLFASVAWLAACDDDGANLFEIKPECKGAAVTAYQGTQPQVISKLAIGSKDDGFDLDGDKKPDNKLAAVSSIAQAAIDEALADYEIVIPIEFYDLQAAAEDSCVKFAVYLGAYVRDDDKDDVETHRQGGDCNDRLAASKPGAIEIFGNRRDDDCDGLADENAQDQPSTDTGDMDADGQSIAAGDCDDTNVMIRKGMPEICNDGLDNDCDGVADRTGGETSTVCSPFDPNNQQDVPLDNLSFLPGTSDAAIAFRDGTIKKNKEGALILNAGPSLFSVSVPVIDGVSLDLRITGARIEGEITQLGNAIVISHGRLGGVIDAVTADTIRGLEVEDIGLTKESSLLDATFANVLGTILALPRADSDIDAKYPGCRTPDIDVDRDGLESFCDSNPDADPKAVDVCIDGNGTEYTDVVDGTGMVVMNCTEAMNGDKRRFVDGISVELNFETSPIKAIKPPR